MKKQQKKVRHMFTVNIKDNNRTTAAVFIVNFYLNSHLLLFLLLILNSECFLAYHRYYNHLHELFT